MFAIEIILRAFAHRAATASLRVAIPAASQNASMAFAACCYRALQNESRFANLKVTLQMSGFVRKFATGPWLWHASSRNNKT
jgi:hypothetical protein